MATVLIPGYTITEILEENEFILCRAVRDVDKFPCILKLVWLSNSEQVRQLEHEYRLAPNLDPFFTFGPLSLERTYGVVFLLYQDFKGQLLSKLPHPTQPDLRIFLKRALNISKAISSIHNKGIIHKNIKPENIFVNPETDEVKIMDFGIATILPSEYYKPFIDPKLIEGTLPYMSPEQTGRMNRNLDYRTDLYSLGITFYQMLTGQLPFMAKDVLEWIYCKLVLNPRALFTVSSKIPKVVSDIIMKLMEKLPENRYQSMHGLIWDLTRCLDQLEKHLRIEWFELGQKDVSEKLNISQVVYGRENEIQLLKNTFENVVKTGKSALVLISGYSGVGKTALARELYKPIVHERGFFICGKFEQLKRDVPYFTMAEALRTLIKTILCEPEDKLTTWKQNLIKTLGINGKIITDIIPQLELIIGKQPAVAKLPPAESQNRFNLVFEKFIQAFAKQEHPLTIFIDDLQWADLASLELVQRIITNPDNSYILILGAYRDNEVDPSHPLIVILNEIKKTSTRIKEIVLSPLKLEDVEHLIADSVASSVISVNALSELIYNKAAGNPFFTIQFLLVLNQEKLLRFDYESGNWIWDTEKIKAKEYTNNVVDLMVEKIKRLDKTSENLLRLAACIGNKFDIKTLAIIASETVDEVIEGLQASLKEGLVYNYNHSIKFLHDRVQQTAYSLIPEEDKKEIHLKIARLLLHNISKKELEEEIFNLVTQFNRSDLSLLDPNEKLKVAELNLLAAKKARASIAYESAKAFSDSGIRLLSEQAWYNHYQLIFNLTIIKAECEYLKGSFNLTDAILNFLLTKTISKIQRADVFSLKIDIRVSMGKMPEAIDVTIECLKIFNIHLSAHPTSKEVSVEFQKTIKNIGNRRAEDFLTLPLMTNQEVKAAIEILAKLYGPSFSTDANLYTLHVLAIIDLSLKFGNAPASAYAYNLFGFILASRLKKYKEAYAYSKMAIDLIEKHQFISYKAKAYLVYSLIIFWSQGVDKAREIARQGFDAGWENGDLFYAGYCGYAAVSYFGFFKGDFLDESLKEVQTMLDFIAKYKLKGLELSLLFNKQFIKKLQDINYNYYEFNGEILDQDKFEEEILKSGDLNVSVYYIRNLKSSFIYQEKEAALVSALKLDKLLWVNNGTIREFEYYYYCSLTLCANYESASPEDKNKYLHIIEQNQKLLLLWADNCPENFRDKYELVSAELCRVTGKIEKASELYENAIKSAKINGFIHKEAICFELASEFYRERGFELFADTYIKKAADLYSLWGASGKVCHLRKNYPFLKGQHLMGESLTFERMPLEQLDVLSIIKASQALASEMVLEKLINVLMRIVIELAGAEKAVLLFERDDLLTVASEANPIGSEIRIKTFDTIKLPDPHSIPLNIIHYVKRTQEKVVLDDASLPNLFSSDHYLSENNLKSIACLPIIKQTKLIGILYLENNLFTDAFSPDKILTLEILASRTAISIENSILFTDLKNSKQLLQDTMDNTSATIFAKKLDGRYLFVNQQFEKLYHIPKEEAIGMTDYEIFSKEFADRFSRKDHRVWETGKALTYEEKVPQKDGIHTTLVLKFPLRDTLGKQYAICGIATDITDKKRTEEIIQHTNKELIKTTEYLDDFIYTASHDLKAPITNFEGLVSILRDPEFNQEQERFVILDMMNKSVEQFKKTIQDLESVSEAQRNRSEEIEEIDFKKLLDEILYSLKDQIEAVHAIIKMDFSQCKKINFSKNNLLIILRQLITNAIKFRYLGRTIEISIKTDILENNFILLTVQDNGIGIASDKTDKIFSMFKKMHGQTEGTGVGLYIVKRIIENAGGTIEVESIEGQGTKFKIYLKNFSGE